VVLELQSTGVSPDKCIIAEYYRGDYAALRNRNDDAARALCFASGFP
jgi:hypothetical protein